MNCPIHVRAMWSAACAAVLALAIAPTASAQSGANDLWLYNPVPVVKQLPVDDLQRSAIIDSYRESGDSPEQRGETIYFYKCWMCHNQYTQDRGPTMKGIYQRQSLMAPRKPVTDENMMEKIKMGSAVMPGFRYSLNDKDIRDLLAYIKSNRCCLEGEDPPKNPYYKAETNPWPVQKGLKGGAHGTIQIETKDSAEGIGVQLIAPNNVRTTVFTNEKGDYEFPAMKAGTYTLRIANPREFKMYHREVKIDGTTKLDNIVLEKLASPTGALPPGQETQTYLSSAELLWNLPGTAQEKDSFLRACTSCHSWNQILRVRFDEAGWKMVVNRMANYSLTWLGARKVKDANGRASNGEILTDDDVDRVAAWLAKVRGPESKDPEFHYFPRPHDSNTRVIITEYELPRTLLNLHDGFGDSQGGVWFTSHRSLYAGKLDPATGVVTGYMMPKVEGKLPGTHAVRPGRDGTILLSENWSRKLDVLDPKTGNIRQQDQGGFSNFGTDKEGYVYYARDNVVNKMDPATGKIVKSWPGHCDSSSYDNPISWDDRYWSGGGRPSGNNCASMLDLQTGQMYTATSGRAWSTAKRGGFDPFGNSWWGGGNGALIKMSKDSTTLKEYFPPLPPSPYTYFYEANADKNGNVWGGVLYGQQFVRLDPKTEKWNVYWMAEPLAFNRRTYIDNSTNPVTVYYADYNTGYLVRIQPLD